MKIRTASSLISSLRSASFKIGGARDCRGLSYRCRQDLMSMRLLRQDPFPAAPGMAPRGRLQTHRNLPARITPVLHRESRT